MTIGEFTEHLVIYNNLKNRVSTLLLTKNSTTFQDPQNVFPGLCHSPAMLSYRKTAATYSVYTV